MAAVLDFDALRYRRDFGVVAAVAADGADVAAYRRRLASAPWFYEHSDSHSEWRAGRDEFKALVELQVQLDPSGAIWREVAPAKMACGLAIPQPRVGGVS